MLIAGGDSSRSPNCWSSCGENLTARPIIYGGSYVLTIAIPLIAMAVVTPSDGIPARDWWGALFTTLFTGGFAYAHHRSDREWSMSESYTGVSKYALMLLPTAMALYHLIHGAVMMGHGMANMFMLCVCESAATAGFAYAFHRRFAFDYGMDAGIFKNAFTNCQWDGFTDTFGATTGDGVGTVYTEGEHSQHMGESPYTELGGV